jgi:hypothetical protein
MSYQQSALTVEADRLSLPPVHQYFSYCVMFTAGNRRRHPDRYPV